MNEYDKNLIERMPDGELNAVERQETRMSNHKIIHDMISSDDIRIWGERVDGLWWALGWLVLTLKNWKALAIAAAAIAIIGGQDLISLLADKAASNLK